MFTKLVLAARILLGIVFLVFGLNGLLLFTVGKGFIPMPPPTAEMGAIMSGFMATKYLLPLVKLLEVAAGILLLCGCYLNLSLVLLAPIIVNILGIHLFVDLSGAPMSLIITALYLIILKSRWEHFRFICSR